MQTETKTDQETKTVQRTQGEQFHLENFGRTMFEHVMYNSDNKKIVILDFGHLDTLAEKENYSTKILKAVNEYDALKEENKRLLKALIDCQYQLQTWAESDAWSNDDEKAYNSAAKVIKSAKQALK